MYSDAHREIKPGEHPGMHRTQTVDYALMLQGELVAIMDEEETVLRAGDVLIQRGTNHAWANRSGQPARIAFILIDAQ
jgi:quercetin dioxygenase-like cupin family protein